MASSLKLSITNKKIFGFACATLHSPISQLSGIFTPPTGKIRFWGFKNVDFQGRDFLNAVYASGWITVDVEMSQKSKAKGMHTKVWRKKVEPKATGFLVAHFSLAW